MRGPTLVISLQAKSLPQPRSPTGAGFVKLQVENPSLGGS